MAFGNAADWPGRHTARCRWAWPPVIAWSGAVWRSSDPSGFSDPSSACAWPLLKEVYPFTRQPSFAGKGVSVASCVWPSFISTVTVMIGGIPPWPTAMAAGPCAGWPVPPAAIDSIVMPGIDWEAMPPPVAAAPCLLTLSATPISPTTPGATQMARTVSGSRRSMGA